jgi:TonB family protein
MSIRRAALPSLFVISSLTLAACAASSPPPLAVPTTQAEYDKDVIALVARNTKEPPAMAGGDAAGTAHIAIILDPAGKLISADVEQSSGIPGLDNFALDAIQNTQFPRLPANVPQQAQGFDLPINFGPPQRS